MDIELLRNRLIGPSFRRLMAEKKTNKYQISKACRIGYNTLCLWQRGTVRPSDEKVLLVAEFLGLISGDEKLNALLKKAQEIQNEIKELKGQSDSPRP